MRVERQALFWLAAARAWLSLDSSLEPDLSPSGGGAVEMKSTGGNATP